MRTSTPFGVELSRETTSQPQPATADDPNGSGVSFYVMFRGSANIAGFPANIGEFSDYFSGVTPGSYTYTILSCDQFYNCSTTVFTATTAPAGATDPRQVGLRPTGTSWGGGGENINILSGNLNYTLPLLTAKGRGGLTLSIALNYNSQNWRKDIATWNYGRDIGYGYGMKLGAGSIQMFLNDSWIVDHYTFTDSTGAQYRLRTQVVSIADQTPTSSNTGIWATTTDSATFIFDANTRKLYFPNGTWWFFGCTSFGNEGDATSMYPTLIQDSNGNQIIIRYKQGVSAVDTLGNNVCVFWSNSSGRIDQIEDVRAIYNGSTYTTYQFNYNNDPGVPHLTSITNSISTAEGYTFTYSGTVALTSPWGASFGNTTKLTGMTISGVGSGYSFEYDPLDSYGSAITKVKFPYGGWLRWAYADGTYSASRVQKEVANRYLSKDGSTETAAYAFTATHDASPGTMRQTVTFNDPGGIGQKVWSFNTSGTTIGLISQYKGNDRSSGTVTLQQVDTTWTSAAFGPYISATLTTMNPGVTGAVAKKVEQTLDTWGNLTQMKVRDYSNVVRRTYDMTYLSTSNYTSRYIRNRLLTAQVTEGATVVGLVTNVYDSYGGSMITAFTPRQFDSTYTTSFIYRGNVTQTATVSGTTGVVSCDNTGNVLQTVDAAGVVSSSGITSTTNFAAPSSITVGSLTSNFQYAADLLPTQAQGPNGDTATTTYDSYARPSSVTSKTGATTYFNYTNFNTTTLAPAQTLSYANGRVTRSTLDGFGRPTKAESGTGTRNGTTGVITLSTVLSTVDSQYDPCGCSPLGKLSKTSRPYAPAGTVYWTIYGYDGIGRTLSVKSPDGASTTSYSYLGAKVTVTDAAAKTKSFITDEVGNLTQVQETDPALGAVNTNYT